MSGVKILRRLKQGYVNKKKIFGFDVETRQEECVKDDGLHYIKQEFLCGALVGDNFRRFYRNKKMMQREILAHHTQDAFIFATNLDFDFNILFDDDLYGMKPIDRNGTFIMTRRRHRNSTWTFLDTMNYLPFGVKRLGEMLDCEKLDYDDFSLIPKTWEEWQAIKEYNIRDAEISQKGGKFIQEFCNTIQCRHKPTLASTGIDLWRRGFLKKDLFQESREMLDKHFEGSIRGGRTEVFKRGYFEKLFYYDYNSMYPAMCKYGVDGKGSYPDPSSARHIADSSPVYIEQHEGISFVEVRSPDRYIPLLGQIIEIEDDRKLVFPSGTFSGWFTHVELRKALREGYEITAVKESIVYPELFTPFPEVVDFLYRLRQRYKKEGNSPMEKMVKVLMNGGLFGKFGQKINERTVVYRQDEVFAANDGQMYTVAHGRMKILENPTRRGQYVYDKISHPMRCPVFIMPILASYTTAMARCHLYDDLVKYSGDVAYTDTDSLMLLKKRFRDSSKLGQLKLEAVMDDALIVAPKQYCYSLDGRDKVRVKGVPQSCVPSRDSFIRLLEGDKAEWRMFTKVRMSHVRKLPYGSIISCLKGISTDEKKRSWQSPFSFRSWGDSRPLVVS